MHFVTGGAFNGKRAWVKENYEVNKWVSAYDRKAIPFDFDTSSGKVIVLEGLEYWTRQLTEKMSINEAREYLRNVLDAWLTWMEQEPGREIIVIGNDIMKGIVPRNKEERNWRDLTGWFYQDVVRKSRRVDVIWYGINQTIKEEK